MEQPWKNQKSNNNKEHQAFIETQNCCALCGNELKITVESYLCDYNLREEAFCERCEIKTRIKDHKLH
ncbi:MAG: hypothetical protein KDD50_08735 [Bdellovibrionales bacterium]|nr:hypothetical protein [Bdellovibrionales bacterium]